MVGSWSWRFLTEISSSSSVVTALSLQSVGTSPVPLSASSVEGVQVSIDNQGSCSSFGGTCSSIVELSR